MNTNNYINSWHSIHSIYSHDREQYYICHGVKPTQLLNGKLAMCTKIIRLYSTNLFKWMKWRKRIGHAKGSMCWKASEHRVVRTVHINMYSHSMRGVMHEENGMESEKRLHLTILQLMYGTHKSRSSTENGIIGTFLPFPRNGASTLCANVRHNL